MMAPTFPNRFFLHAAQTDRTTTSVDQIATMPAIWDRLAAALDPFDHVAMLRARKPKLARVGLSAPKIRTLKAIAKLMGHVNLSGPVPGNVGGQPAYTVTVSPKHDGGLLGSAEVAWDAVYGGFFHNLQNVDENRWVLNKFLWVQDWQRAQRLLFTAEKGSSGGVWQSTTDVNAQVKDISAALGRGGYEGIQNDLAGQLTIVEDVGGATVPGTNARIPNSFVYRFVPVNPSDLTKGKLQALQVFSDTSHQPITFQPIDAAHPQGNAFSADQKALHTYGNSFDTKWVTIHEVTHAVQFSGVPWLRAHMGGLLRELLENLQVTIAGERVTLVYASAYLNSPASMYGHTFLRLSRSTTEGRCWPDRTAAPAARLGNRSDAGIEKRRGAPDISPRATIPAATAGISDKGMQPRSHSTHSFGQHASARRRIRRTTADHRLFCSTNGCATLMQLDPTSAIAVCPICGARRVLA